MWARIYRAAASQQGDQGKARQASKAPSQQASKARQGTKQG